MTQINAIPTQASQQTEADIANVQNTIAPPAIEVDFSDLKVGDTYLRTLFVVGYPRYVSANWLSPLINFNHSLDVAMYIYPTESKDTLDQLRRRIAEMEAEISTDIQRGRLPQAATEAALEDAKSLQSQLVKGVERFYQFSLYVTIGAESVKELNTITKQVQSTLGSLLIVSKVASLSMEEAFKTTLPYFKDRLLITRNMDTTALSTTFPFTSSDLSDNKGVLYGTNMHNESLVIFDRFSLENANMLVLATSGARKSLADSDEVVIKNAANEVKRTNSGPLIEKIIQRKGSISLEKDIEGNSNPGIKVYSFDPKTLKSSWSSVTVAARKKSPKTLYKFTTKSGREITTTADHNLLTLKDTKISVSKGSTVKVGDYLPLPRHLSESTSSTSKHSLEYYALLGGKADTKKVPSILFAEKNDLKAAYLRSYFSGDGCVEAHEVTCVTKSKVLLLIFPISSTTLASLPESTQIQKSHQFKTSRRYLSQLTISGQDNLKKFAKHIGFNLGYKNQKLKN